MPNWKRKAVLKSLLVVLCFLTGTSSAIAQQKRFYDQEPYDQLTTSKGTVILVKPINFPNRRVPNPKPNSGQLQVQLMEEDAENPDKKFNINWSAIKTVELFENMVLTRANKLVEGAQFDEAYHWYRFLRNNYPNTANLQPSIQAYLFINAGAIYRDKPRQAFGILRELYSLNPNYQQPNGPSVAQAVNSVSDKILGDFLKANDYSSARKTLVELDREFGESRLPAIGKYKSQLNAKAEVKKAEVQQLTAAGKHREAYFASREMMGIWPKVAQGAELTDAAARRYPIVVVAVAEASSIDDPSAIDNWPARRTGRLMHRYMMEFIGAGPEGGEYLCPWGRTERSEDLKQLTIRLSKKARRRDGREIDGYQLARRLLNLADPNHPTYQPSWADLIEGVYVENVFNVRVDLRRPNVLTEPLLQLPLDPNVGGKPAPPEGPYELLKGEGDERRFVLRPDYAFKGATQPAEIVERTFKDSAFAIAALRNGEVDIIDRLFPSQVAELQEDTKVVVGAYETPTLHMLVPNFDRTYPANRTFRRAMLLAINRDSILKNSLLEGKEMVGSRLISGPFPAGRNAEDPLAYAYDENIPPREYFPQHAALLVSLAQLELNEIAKLKKEKPPKLEKLVLAHPSGEQARIACQAIAAQWKIVAGVPVELKPLPVGQSRDPSGDYDFLYSEVLVREPIVDSRRLLAADGVVGVENPYIGSGLRRLETASNWRDVRARLHDIHRTTFSESAVMPLWQIVDHFAYHRGLRGVGTQPSTLYQNIERWQIEPRPIE